MRNYYLEALSQLVDLLPDIVTEIEEHASERDNPRFYDYQAAIEYTKTGKPKSVANPKEAREFCLFLVDEFIERLQEARQEVEKMKFK